MKMIKVKTYKLTGPALDWAVAKSCDLLGDEIYTMPTEPDGCGWRPVFIDGEDIYSPSTNWAQGGPLIEKYKPWMSPPVNDPDQSQPHGWDAEIYDDDGNFVIGRSFGCSSALIAICRSIVSSKIGYAVSVPAELVSNK